MLGCESVACHAQAFVRQHARHVVEKSNAWSSCYSRYRADDAGRRFAEDDSNRVIGAMEPATVI
jgi:hypothetical protein